MQARREVINAWLVELFAAAGDPILVSVARRARLHGARAGTQRLSDWRRGVSSPRQFADLRPYLLALFDIADKHGADRQSYRRRLDDWEMLWTSHSTTAPSSELQGCPYPGLLSFGPDDSDVFFGREELTRRLHRQIVPGAGITAVLGPAGVGKTSLMNAGVGPLAVGAGLHVGRRKVMCAVTSMTPGSEPVSELLDQLGLQHVIDGEEEIADQIIALLTEREALARLVFVDQCEDLYTKVGPRERARFLSIMDRLAIWSGAAVVVALRADFYVQALSDPQLAYALERRSVVVKPIAVAHLPQTIEKPARARGVAVAPGLADRIIKDLTAEGGNVAPLAMLQLLMSKTWEARDSSSLTTASYIRTGGIAGIVSTAAEDAYRALTLPQQDIARQLFMQLIHITPDGSAVAIKMVMNNVDAADRQDVDDTDVVNYFLKQRLLVLADNELELSHRSLLKSWPRLRDWVAVEREWAPIRRFVEVDAEQWAMGGRNPLLLYGKTQLDSTEPWLLHQRTPGLRVANFLELSRVQERRNRQRTRLAQSLVAVLALIAVVASLLSASMSDDSKMALDIADHAVNLAQIDRTLLTDPTASANYALQAMARYPSDKAIAARVLATQSDSIYQRFPDPARAAWSVSSSGDLIAFANKDGSIQLWRNTSPLTLLDTVVDAHKGYTTTIALDLPHGNMASTGADGTVRTWRIRDDGRIDRSATVSSPGSFITFGATYSPNGTVLATTNAFGALTLWDVADISAPVQLSVSATGSGPSRTVAWHPSLPLVLTGNDDNTMTLWDVVDSRHPRALQTSTSPSGVHSVAFSPNGRVIASADESGDTQLWTLDNDFMKPIGAALSGPKAAIWSAVFSPDGSELGVSSLDGSISLWHVTNPEKPVLSGAPPRSGGTSIYGSVFLDDNSLVSATAGEPMRWHLPDGLVPGGTGQGQQPSCAAKAGLCVVTFDGGATLLANTQDPNHPYVTALLPNHQFESTALSDDGQLIATIEGHVLQLWDLSDQRSPRPIGQGRNLDNHFRNHLKFSPSGNLLATTTTDNAIGIWAIDHGGLIARGSASLTGYWINAASFSPSGHILAVGGVGGAVARWNVSADGTLVTTPEENIGSDVSALTFTADELVLVIGRGDGHVQWWPQTELAPVAGVTVGVGPILTIMPIGRTLAISGDSGAIRLVDSEADLSVADAAIGPSQRGRTRLAAMNDNYIFVTGGSGFAQVITTDPSRVCERLRSLM